MADDDDAVEAAKLALLSLVDASLEGKEEVSTESKLAELEATIATQVEFYFSAENLPGDQFLQEQLKQGGDNKVALKVVAKFNKMKKLLARLAKLSGTEGAHPSVGLLKLLAAAASPHLLFSDDGTRIGSSAPAPEAPDETLLLRTVQAYCLPSGATIASVREQFGVCGAVRTVRMPQGSPGDANGAPRTNGAFAEVEFEAAEAAFKACDTLTDTKNWRGGLRVTLRENMTVAAARRRLLAKSGSSKKKGPKKKEASGAAEGAALESSDREEGSSPEVPLEGRRTGVVHNLKGPFGFIVPDNVAGGRAKTAGDNLYFKTKQLVGLGVGSAVEYEAAVVNGKLNAVNVAALSGGGPPNSGTADAAPAAPLQGHRHTKPQPPPAAAYEPRPESFRPKLQAKQVRMAAGPDSTLGFTEGWRPLRDHGFGGLKRSTSSSGSLDAGAAEWAPKP